MPYKPTYRPLPFTLKSHRPLIQKAPRGSPTVRSPSVNRPKGGRKAVPKAFRGRRDRGCGVTPIFSGYLIQIDHRIKRQ
jgi:hypothetical protein